MAIDNDTSYELTGAQVKDLAQKIRNKADNNTFVGASSGAAGSAGLVPTPLAGDQTKFLKGDGSWATVGGGSSMPTIYMTDDGYVFDGSIFNNMLFPNNGFAFSADPIDHSMPGSAVPMSENDFDAIFASGYPVLVEGDIMQEGGAVGHGIITCYAIDSSGHPKFRFEYMGKNQYYAGTADFGQADPGNGGVKWSWQN